MEVTTYRLAQFLLLIVFTVFISDRRQRPGMAPLIDSRAILLLKACYLLPIGAYAWSLARLELVRPRDYVALLLAGVGTALVVKAKIDLGSHHTWTGYYLRGGAEVRRGAYRWLAHPMCVGISLMILGGTAVYVGRLPWYVSAGALMCCLYVLTFFAIVCRRERGVLSGTWEPGHPG